MSQRPGRRAYLLVTLFALLLVLFPFLFWYRTWFGRKLSDSQIDEYLADRSAPRHAQHALVQIGERLSHSRDVSRWYPAVIEEASSPSLELRQTAAWIMGQDRKYAPFHEALLRLIHDPEAMVRRNAALALSVFGDPAARPELVSMLRPFTIEAPAAGTLKYRLKLGDYVNPGTKVALIGDMEVRAPVPGEVRSLDRRDGSVVQKGDGLADLSADQYHVWEALRALYLVGDPSDLEAIERYLRPLPGMPDTIQKQAASTVEAIKSRTQSSTPTLNP
ncbi:MAG TPA: HEAT repeat domain-containing protein [Bryobacteraceae bacterium]|nr:HEAT repeat domain-containing protein [Bryobacteraceae bacterium]